MHEEERKILGRVKHSPKSILGPPHRQILRDQEEWAHGCHLIRGADLCSAKVSLTRKYLWLSWLPEWLRALLTEEQRSASSTHTAAHNYITPAPGDVMLSADLHRDQAHTIYIYTFRQKIHTHEIKINKIFRTIKIFPMRRHTMEIQQLLWLLLTVAS